jgi:energy-coupling factor transporter ATP-binding protein EcfA2
MNVEREAESGKRKAEGTERLAVLEVRDLRFRYADGVDALRGISFSVNEGDCVGLVGPNGAGKSTLLLHLNGILPERFETSPSVFVFGNPIAEGNLSEVRRNVGLLFQDADDQLLCPTVFEDVAFGPEQFGLGLPEIAKRVHRALDQVGLTGFEKRAPYHLSRGEKRRVCLAGVLACDPRVLVLDEPTSELDPRGKRELKALLQQIPATKIIATHDLELVVELCPRAILLDRGELIADGPTVPLLSDERLMLAHGLERPHILQHRHPH